MNYQDILNQASAQRNRINRLENIACDVLGFVLLGFVLFTVLAWARII